MKKEFETKDLYDLIFPKKEEHRCRKSIPVMRSRACGDGKCNDSISNSNFIKHPLGMVKSNNTLYSPDPHSTKVSFSGMSRHN